MAREYNIVSEKGFFPANCCIFRGDIKKMKLVGKSNKGQSLQLSIFGGKEKDGTKKPNIMIFATAWGKTGNDVEEYYQEGDTITVRCQYTSYKDASGTYRNGFNVTGLIDRDGDDEWNKRSREKRNAAETVEPNYVEPDSDTELPFEL